MKVLILWSDDASTNLGVRALAAGAETMCRRAWGDVTVEHATYGFTRVPVRLWNRRELATEVITRRAGFVRWMRQFDAVVDTRAGDSFSDIYGPRRHDGMSLLFEIARQSKVPLVLAPQTIGPFGTRRARWLARRTLRHADLVMARDLSSAEVARRLGRADVLESTDVVFALDQPQAGTARDVVLNVSGLLWHPNPHVDHLKYRSTLTQLHAEIVSEGRSVSLLSHVLESSSPDQDTPACREFAESVGGDTEVVVPASLDHVREVLAGAQVVVGSRMHACLNALSVGTPAIALAYSRKFAPLMSDIGWHDVLDLRTEEDVVGAALGMLHAGGVQDRVAASLALAHQRLATCEDSLRALLR